MDASILIPTPDAIPVHWLWLQILLTSTTFLHLLAMNLMLGSGVISLATPNGPAGEAAALRRDIGRVLPFTIAATINLGVAPLLFLQVLYGQFFYTSSVLMASLWLSVVGLLVVAYSAAYLFTMRYDSLGRDNTVLGLTVILLALIGFLFSNNISLMQTPEHWKAWFSCRDGWLLNFRDQALIPRYLHFFASAIAIGGLGIAFFYELQRRRGDNSGARWRTLGCNWFSYASIINFPIGFWFLAFIPQSSYDGATLSGRLFIPLLAATIFGIAKAIIAALRDRVMPATFWALAAVFFMTVARDLVRLEYLKPWFSLSRLPESPQYSPLLLFLVLTAAMGWCVWWMLKTVWRREVKS
ncbi:MAG: hypothetical protein HGA96_11830 [Desulfobulbaceae bacterium]|nr:hypothetical protein [Desulfobulbaceae bacterium]